MKNQYKEQMKKRRHHRTTRDSCLEVLRATGLGLILMGCSAVEAGNEITLTNRTQGSCLKVEKTADTRTEQKHKCVRLEMRGGIYRVINYGGWAERY